MIACLQLVREFEQNGESVSVTVGGGEPTLHPDCIQFVKWVAQELEKESYNAGISMTGVVTNGSREKQALELAKLARQGEITARLSYDGYHDLSKVSKKVWKAFQAKYDDEIYYDKEIGCAPEASDNDGRNMNPMSYFITPHGRALKNGLSNHPFRTEDSCNCEGVFVTPDGVIWQCGCRKVPMGHLNALSSFWPIYHANLNSDGDLPCSNKHVLQQPMHDFQLEYA
jgi:MoaA/NifB/PqqE/SkfB family radical SAM enzyme